jgi:hypothetical protein
VFGKLDYMAINIFTVQAINRNQKRSLVSAVARINVADADGNSVSAPQPAQAYKTFSPIAAPITFLEESLDSTSLGWSDVPDAADYKLRCNKRD